MPEKGASRVRLSANYVNTRPHKLAGLILVAAILEMAAAVGLAYMAGFSKEWHVLTRVKWGWLVLLAGCLALSFVGYYYACRGVYEVEGGPGLTPPQMRSVVVAGFGGFLAHGGSALDNYALRAAGEDEKGANIRVGALAGLEHGVLSLVTGVGAAIVIALAIERPPLDFTIPWVAVPIPAFIAAFAYAARRGPRLVERWGDAGGVKQKVAGFVSTIELVRHLFMDQFKKHPAVLGMALFWVTEIVAVWAGMAAFGFKMNLAVCVVAVATGMVFTRRTGPLAGAGILMLTLTLTIWYSGAPLAVAVVGIFAYRVLSTWVPMPFGVAQLPRLRKMGRDRVSGAEGHAGVPSEPALPD